MRPWRAAWALVAVLVLASACDDGSARDAATTSSTVSSSSTVTSPVTPTGFTMIVVEVTRPDGTVEEICVWLADTMEQRQQGLMRVTDLGGADGMLFAYDEPIEGRFWMHDTPMPLSIAFFDADGGLVSTTEMEPCLDGPTAECPRYSAEAPYTHALEVPRGRLADVGVEPGSTLNVVSAGSASCPDG